jgi:hypothetical protein
LRLFGFGFHPEFLWVKWPTARLGIETILVALVVACDATAPLEISGSLEEDPGAMSIIAKTDPSIAADVQAGRLRQVLVVLSERALRFRRVKFAARSVRSRPRSCPRE